MQCGNCGTAVAPGAPACGRCGASMGIAYPTCPRCRVNVHPQAAHCHACGMGLAVAAPAAAVAAAPQPAYVQRGCQRCGVAVPPNYTHCQNCMAALAAQPARPTTVPCPRCRAQVVIGSYSCQACGFVPGIGAAVAQQPVLPKSGGVAAGFWSQLDRHASLEKLEGFSLKEMFSEVFRKRTQDEIDEYFQVGSPHTTPEIVQVPTGWPKPWFFGRVLLFVGMMYLVQYIAFLQFQNTIMLPGMMIMGALAMPFATAILFFELNAPRNVPFHRVLMLVGAGGVLSIFVSLIGFQISSLHHFLGAPAAGIVEEIGKLIAVVMMMRKMDKLYLLNGVLFGAAVGAGFAAFESAGYAFNAFLSALPDKSGAGILFASGAMVKSITLRGILAPFGHVAWTAITAGVLWRSRAHTKTMIDAMLEGKFVRAFFLVMLLHATWNFTAGFGLIFGLPFMVLVGVVSWYIVFGLVQQGLRQVRAAQSLTKTGLIRAFDQGA